METLVLVIHVVAAIGVIALVLLQQGKGAQMGAAFGSGASQTVFGSQGSVSFMTKATAGLALVFFATSLTLAVMARQQAESATSIDMSSGEVPSSEVSGSAEAPGRGEKDGSASRESTASGNAAGNTDKEPSPAGESQPADKGDASGEIPQAPNGSGAPQGESAAPSGSGEVPSVPTQSQGEAADGNAAKSSAATGGAAEGGDE